MPNPHSHAALYWVEGLFSAKLCVTAEAHKLLSAVYNWFTEGFATKDLQEAKALLAELAGE